MTDVVIRAADWQADNDALRQIRSEVFITEQHVPEPLEWDGEDEHAMHWLAILPGQQAVGTVRMLGDGHIGRMAVLAPYRGRGIGTALLKACLEAGQRMALPRLWLHAQVAAIGFYARHGFHITSDIFDDAGIPHQGMELLPRPLDLPR